MNTVFNLWMVVCFLPAHYFHVSPLPSGCQRLTHVCIKTAGLTVAEILETNMAIWLKQLSRDNTWDILGWGSQDLG